MEKSRNMDNNLLESGDDDSFEEDYMRFEEKYGTNLSTEEYLLEQTSLANVKNPPNKEEADILERLLGPINKLPPTDENKLANSIELTNLCEKIIQTIMSVLMISKKVMIYSGEVMSHQAIIDRKIMLRVL